MYQDKNSSESEHEENVLDVSDPLANRVTTSSDVQRKTNSDVESETSSCKDSVSQHEEKRNKKLAMYVR